ncbi:MAG: hypothetical protein KKB59_19510, partial [Spirochaetes bacterium]|nr:hypothetical protein [Spirochaetota bacterium]
MNKKTRTIFALVAIVCLIYTLTSTVIIYAVLEEGFVARPIYMQDLPTTASYVINTNMDGAYTWATRDDGCIVFSGTNATSVSQSVVDAILATGSGTLYYKGGNTHNFGNTGILIDIDSMDKAIEITGDPLAKILYTGSGVAFNFTGHGNVHSSIISNLLI